MWPSPVQTQPNRLLQRHHGGVSEYWSDHPLQLRKEANVLNAISDLQTWVGPENGWGGSDHRYLVSRNVVTSRIRQFVWHPLFQVAVTCNVTLSLSLSQIYRCNVILVDVSHSVKVKVENHDKVSVSRCNVKEMELTALMQCQQKAVLLKAYLKLA